MMKRSAESSADEVAPTSKRSSVVELPPLRRLRSADEGNLTPWFSAVRRVVDQWAGPFASCRTLPAEITPWLLLSDAESARSARILKLCGVTHVLNMAGGECSTLAAARDVGAIYKRIDAQDQLDYPLYRPTSLVTRLVTRGILVVEP